MEDVSFVVDSQRLAGTLHIPQHTTKLKGAILFIHGWMSSRKRNSITAQALLPYGFACMTFDLRSHGESEGERKTLSRADYLKDCLAAYDLLRAQKNVDANKIYIVGSSFGSYLACLLSKERNVAGLVLRVPANYPDEGFDKPQVKIAGGKTTEWRGNPLSYKDGRSLRALHDFSKEVLIVQAEHDDLVPAQTIQNYSNAIKDNSLLTKEIIKGADHSMHDNKSYKKYEAILIEWFEKSAL